MYGNCTLVTHPGPVRSWLFDPCVCRSLTWLQELLGRDGAPAFDHDAAAEWIYRQMRDNNTPEWNLLAKGIMEVRAGNAPLEGGPSH